MKNQNKHLLWSNYKPVLRKLGIVSENIWMSLTGHTKWKYVYFSAIVLSGGWWKLFQSLADWSSSSEKLWCGSHLQILLWIFQSSTWETMGEQDIIFITYMKRIWKTFQFGNSGGTFLISICTTNSYPKAFPSFFLFTESACTVFILCLTIHLNRCFHDKRISFKVIFSIDSKRKCNFAVIVAY